ncbi:hypothetical protein L7F22_058931 [Adiantum nelumboides]|nr:hypothetical protein [Adiantum nelumboides]
MLQALEEAKRYCTQMEKKEAWKKAGLSGHSILWRLYDLYGFDLPIDLVYDAMHTLSLNLFKKYICDLFEDASPNLKKEIDDAVCTVTNLVPTSIRFGRWPNSPSVYHDSFKAEENQKFMQWRLPYILRVVSNIPLEMELLDYTYTFVFIENGELLDDVLRHGLHDRFWCYIFERLVKAYSSIKTNNLNNEASFVQFHLRSGFTRVFQALQKDLDGLLPRDRLIQELHASLNLPYAISQQCGNMDICVPSHKRGILVVSSVEKAKSISSSFLTHGEDKPCLDTLVNKGIAISTKRLTYREADANEVQYLKSFWAIDSDSYQINNLTVYNTVFFKGEVYKVGEYVVVKVDDRAAPSHHRGHWKACIKSIFSMQHKNEIMVFFAAKHPVGVNEKLQEALVLMKSHDVHEGLHKLGIYGTGGMGKTTLAKSIYNEIYRDFDGFCFIESVRADAKSSNGLLGVQERILRDLLKDEAKLEVLGTSHGKQIMRDRCLGLKILLILDDIDDREQLEVLLSPFESCHLKDGSQVVITTRDEQIVKSS